MSYVRDYKWITLGLLLALFGSTLSDYDLLYKYLSPWHHRSAITHSASIPTIALLIYLCPICLGPTYLDHQRVDNYALLVVCFMLGFASHLFLDCFPSVDVEKLVKKMKYAEARALKTACPHTNVVKLVSDQLYRQKRNYTLSPQK